MAKDNVYDYDSTAANNLDVGGISVAEGMLPSGVNNAIRELMSHQKDFVTGAYLAGTGNVALGNTALDSLGAGNYNTAVGHNALTANTDGSNTAFGAFSLAAVTTGGNNVAVGREALEANTGDNNTSVGYQALTSNSTASNNTAVGYNAGYSNTTGTWLTAFGTQAGYSQTTPNFNAAFGGQALYSNTTGGNNVAIGQTALYSNTTSSNNTALGYQAGYSHVSSDGNNVFVGQLTGYSTTSRRNTFIGAGAGYNVTSGQANTILGRYNGNQGGLDIRTLNNYIVLSDGDGNPWLDINPNGHIRSNETYTHGMSGSIRAMYVRSDGYIGYNSSIRASKTNIENISDASWLLQLEPKSFNYRVQNNDGTYSDEAIETTSYGLIAEEVEAVNPELCYYDEVDGVSELKGVGYSELITPILKLVQEQQATITALTARIEALEA